MAEGVVPRLEELHRALDACRACKKMIGPVVHGPAIDSRVYLLGQAPGPHEGRFGKPFAWTAGKTLFKWFETALGVPEEPFRARVYLAAVARCFPGKAPGGGDRKPEPKEIARCQPFIAQELDILAPRLVLPVGTLAIEQVLGRKVPLAEVVGRRLALTFHGREVDVICLPHPSGASTWHRTQPGIELLAKALALVGAHPEWKRTFAARRKAG